jgi:hypothetical protein
MEGDVGFDPPGEGHSRYEQIGAHVLHRVVMRAQTIGEARALAGFLIGPW